MALTSLSVQAFAALLFFVYFGASQSSYVNQDDWVDPDDVMNYDRVSKTMIKPEQTRSNSDKWVDPNQPECPLKCCNEHLSKVSSFQDRLSKCEDTIGNLLRSQQTCPDTGKESPFPRNTQPNPVKAVETMYMKRFVNILLRVSGLNRVTSKPEDDALVKSLLIAVKHEQLMALRHFGEDDKMSLGDLDNILSAVLQSPDGGFTIPVPVEWLDYFRQFFSSEEIFLHLTTWAIVVVPVLMIMFQRRYTSIISTFLCLVLVFGFQWKYNYMVKMAEVEHMLAKENGPPPECRPDLMTWSQSLRHALFGDPDLCRKYHREQMVTPVLAITPTIVLTHLVADSIARPMEALGQGIGRFSHGVLENMAWYTGPIVLFVVLNLVVVIIVLLAGGSVGNMFFSLTGYRRRESHRRINVETVSGLPPAANLPALNTPTVVHHIHHDGRDLAGGDASQLAPSPRVDEQRLRAIDSRIAGSPLKIQSEGGSWIKGAISSGIGVCTPEQDSETTRYNQSGGGEGFEKHGKSPNDRVQSVGKTQGEEAGKRFLKRDLKSGSREAVVLREIHSFLSDALQNDVVDEESRVKGVAPVSLVTVPVPSQSSETSTFESNIEFPRDDNSPPTLQISKDFSAESRGGLGPKNESDDDFLSQVVEVLDNEAFLETASGDESSVIESEFMTSIQNILAGDEEVGK